jgi:hypothetical protein
MAVSFCIVLEQNDTTLQQFWLYMAKSWPHLILREEAVISAIDFSTNWHKMVKQKLISAEEHDMYDFQSTMTVLYNFLPWLLQSALFNIPFFQLRVK